MKMKGKINMALSQAQLLKRKANKTKARAEKAKAIQQGSQLQYLPQWPIVSAYAPFGSRDDYTLQQALVVRQRPDGQYAVALFLIDVLCLGVKDSFMRIMPSYQFAALLEKIETVMTMDAVSPSYVATFVHEAVEYANSLGLEPGGNYRVVKESLDGIPLDPSLTFTFGENGEPVYIVGPHDSPEFSNRVIKKLNNTVGSNNYKFIVPMELPEE
jgi:hypothetical protein